MRLNQPVIEIQSPDGHDREIEISGDRLTIGRMPALNDVALDPDPQLLVTRQTHCFVERDAGGWWVVDNGSVNGTFLRRSSGGAMEQVQGRAPLTDGSAVFILGMLMENGEPRYWRLTFRDPLKTRPVSVATRLICLDYDWLQARIYRIDGSSRTEVTGLRPQEHKFIRFMAQRNQANGGIPVLCSYDDLIAGVWGDEAMHTPDELAHLVWSLRRKIEPDPATPRLLETERGLGYRLRTCLRQTGAAGAADPT